MVAFAILMEVEAFVLSIEFVVEVFAEEVFVVALNEIFVELLVEIFVVDLTVGFVEENDYENVSPFYPA